MIKKVLQTSNDDSDSIFLDRLFYKLLPYEPCYFKYPKYNTVIFYDILHQYQYQRAYINQ
jgi:hypothetical protein